ncbi:calmodulin-binding protein 60 C-like isoform X2 [Silene latifolia]|uniref:calmodulin-binding protein 60 C-like isoform X2 n=1 Tax=Silene latifolia TaxID=37657 RepID=UPI003D778FEA
MANFDGVDFGAASTGFCQCTAINSQIIAEVESVKKGMEASIVRLEEALGKLQSSISSIPALVKGEMKEQLPVIPSLVEEAVKTQFRASIPELIQALTVMKEGQRITTLQVEEASRAAPAFSPLAQSLPSPIPTRASPQQDESSNLHLKFAGNLPESKSLFTKEDIKDQGASLKVELHDQYGHKVVVGPESSAKIKIFVVAGDFESEDGDEDISKHVVTPREGKPPLLKGESEILLSKGVASVDEIAFTDNSTFVRSKKFKLGAQVIKGVSPGVIKGAVSDAFRVKEHRNTFNRKQQITLDDEVWHLVNIGEGKTHKKLQDKGINLVKDLLHLYNNDINELRQIFPGGKKKLNQTIEMAKSCAQSALRIQSQMIPDNSEKQVVDTSYEKQNEQTHFPPMTNLTAVEAEPFCSTTINSTMPFMNTIDAYQGEPAMQFDDFPHVSLRELVPQDSLCTTFENQEELPEFYGALSNILNATGADQGGMSYQPEEFGWDLTVDDYITDKESYTGLQYRPGWLVVRAVLRFKVAGKVSAKEGPRAGKRQKLS